MLRFHIKPWMALLALLVLLVASFFGTFFITSRNGTAAEGLVGSAVAPVVSGMNSATGAIRDFFQRLFALRDVDKQYEQLKSRVASLELENQFMADLQKDNEGLTKLLGFKEAYPQYSYLPANVIGKQPGSWFINITLDRGKDDGVEVDMNVVNEHGLVGRVIETGPKWCKVLTIIDRQSAVSAVLERSRDNGMVKGTGDPQSAQPKCGIYYLPFDSVVVPGDKVITSDLGGVFLKGILIGSVTEVSRDQNLQRFAVLSPAVDFAHIENVLIIKSSQDIPTDEKIASDKAAQNGTGK